MSAAGRFDPCCAPDAQRRTLGEFGNLHDTGLLEIWHVYVFAALCAGVAGLMISSNVSAADANNAGLLTELDAILAVVIGGTSLTRKSGCSTASGELPCHRSTFRLTRLVTTLPPKKLFRYSGGK